MGVFEYTGAGALLKRDIGRPFLDLMEEAGVSDAWSYGFVFFCLIHLCKDHFNLLGSSMGVVKHFQNS